MDTESDVVSYMGIKNASGDRCNLLLRSVNSGIVYLLNTGRFTKTASKLIKSDIRESYTVVFKVKGYENGETLIKNVKIV